MDTNNLQTGKHLELKSIDGWEYASRKKSDKCEESKDDAVVVAPIYYSENNKEPKIILNLCYRPPLQDKECKGLHWEVVGGLNNDNDAAKLSLFQNSAKELKEETGVEKSRAVSRKLFKQVASSAGMLDETSTFMTREINGKVHKFRNTDDVGLMMVSVPLKQAFNFLKDQAHKGRSVGMNTLVSVFNALSDLKVMPDFNATKFEPKVLWSAKDQMKEVWSNLQKQGMEVWGKKKI